MTDCFKHRYLETPFNHGWKSQSLLSWSVLVMAWHVGRTPSIRWWSLCPTDGFRCPTDMGKVEIGINHETDTWLDIGESHTPQRIWIPYGFDNIVILMSRKQSEMTRIREDIISFLYRWIQISPRSKWKSCETPRSNNRVIVFSWVIAFVRWYYMILPLVIRN